MSEVEGPQYGPPIVIPASLSSPPGWKWQLITFLRQLAVAVVTSAVIIAGLVWGFHGASEEEKRIATDTLNANLAQACVLALPVDENGRNAQDVKLCFTQYQLPPPSIVRAGE